MLVALIVPIPAGCAFRPLVIERSTLYLGAFNARKDRDGAITHSHLEGLGVMMGARTGAGYLRNDSWEWADTVTAQSLTTSDITANGPAWTDINND